MLVNGETRKKAGKGNGIGVQLPGLMLVLTWTQAKPVMEGGYSSKEKGAILCQYLSSDHDHTA